MKGKLLTDRWREENDSNYQNYDEEEVRDLKDKWRPVFENEFNKDFTEEGFPRHPYKLMQQIRKETDNYHNSSESKEFYQALDELKDEYVPKYRELKKAFNS